MVAHIAHSVLCARNRNNNNNTCKITMKVSDFILLNVFRLHLWFFSKLLRSRNEPTRFWGGLKLKLNDNKLIIIHCLLRAIKTSFHAM